MADGTAQLPVPKVGRNIFLEGVEPGSFEASIIEGEANAVLGILDEGRTTEQVVQIALGAAGCFDRVTDHLAAQGKLSRPACQEGCSGSGTPRADF